MTIYVALLRGINVGGHNKIKMAELKKMFEALGMGRVQTYIQSGNVLFESDEGEAALRERIEGEVAKVFGISAVVVLRTLTQLEGIIGNCPFTEEEVAEAEASSQAESLYVAILTEAPILDGITKVDAYAGDNDKYRVVGRDVYMLFRHSIRDSKLAGNLHKLNVPATVRNWRTTSKLVAQAKAMKV